MKRTVFVGWKRMLSLALSLIMAFSMVDIAPGWGYAAASEVEDAVDVAEPTAPASTESEETTPPVTEEQPTSAPEVTSTPESDVESDATDAPDDTAEPDATAEPDDTAVPDATVEPDPTAVPDDTAAPDAVESSEPTQAPEQLFVSLSADVCSAFVNGDAIDVSLRMEGGAPEYAITYRVYFDGAEVASGQQQTTENTSSYSYVARAFGLHTIEATVTDGTGQTAVASVSVPVAEHDANALAEQRQKAEQVTLTGDWRKDMVAVAASQLGYRESERDFIMDADGSMRSYTAYGDWYGLPYEAWCGMFVSFCASYAGIPQSSIPRASDCGQMRNDMASRGAYVSNAGQYAPQAGDIVFLSAPDRVGIVAYATEDAIHTIEGDCDHAVARASYARVDGRITGYASMRALMIAAGKLDRAVEEARDVIDALPSAEELAGMDIDGQTQAYEQTQAAYDAYMALTEEQRAQIEGAEEKFEALFGFFNGMIMPLAGYSGGTGTAADPYLISKPEEMWDLANNSADWDKHFALTTNIDLNASKEKPWSPIGSGTAVKFSGSFDGRNHTISGLYIETTDHWQGLFGCVSGTVQHLNVEGTIFASGNVGGIVGELRLGNVNNCSFAGSIQAPIDVTGKNGSDTDNGGIVGLNTGGNVSYCSNSATVESKSQHVGGIVGGNSGTNAVVENCSNTGNVTISAADAAGAGGIVGSNNASGKIIACNNSGTVNGTGSNGQIGGIAGQNAGNKILQSYNTGTVTGSKYVGGIAGQNAAGANIEECYNTAQVSGTNMVGGIAGESEGSAKITNCYNQGDVSGDKYVGGIVGQNHNGATKNATVGTVAYCYSRGTVTGKTIGSIVGSNTANAKSGTVKNCYYLASGVSGVGDSDASGQAEAKTAEEFASGEVAWLLQHNQSSLVWGQELVNEQKDAYPLLHNTGVGAGHPQVLKVIFRTSTVENCQMTYSNDGGHVAKPSNDPQTDERHMFYEWRFGDENGDPYEGTVRGGAAVTDDVVTIVAVQREYFGGEEDIIVINAVYGEGVEKDLDAWVAYATGLTSTVGKFTYTFAANGIGAVMEGNKLIVLADTPVNEAGYLLTVTAHEEKPQISPLSITSFGTADVTLNIKVVIGKATPKISVTAAAINYGQTLNDSTLSGEGTHPTTEANVPGKFSWDTPDTKPGVIEAASVGYPVTFTPGDTNNYNPVTTMVTLTVNKVAPDYDAPTPNDATYNGFAQSLITKGSATGGTMKYWVDGDSGEYSSIVPTRVKAGTYTVWYRVFGDDNHTDIDPQYIEVTIHPYELNIPAQSFTYNGSAELTLTLAGVNDETVTVTLTAHDKDAGVYTYSADAGEKRYTATIAEPNEINYIVDEKSGILTIAQRPVILSWNDPLTFVYSSGVKRTVTATVSNKADGDKDSDFNLQYKNNEKIAVGEYTAEVTDPGNKNYTLGDDAQNLSQLWHITKEKKTVALEEVDPITYGDALTITAKFGPDSSGINETDTVEFSINGKPLSGTVKIDIANNAATITIENAASNLGFSVGANLASVKYDGNNDEEPTESDAITITVHRKPITAAITGDNTAKVYDGDNIASGLALEPTDVEDCDIGFVSAAAKSYTYNSANVADAKTITANGIELSGAQSGNYVLDDKQPVEISGSILAKTVQLEWKGTTGLVYTGNPVNVTASVIEPVAGDVVSVTVNNGTQKDADTYTAAAVGLTGADGEPNTNYALPDDGTAEQEYTIAPAELIIPSKTVTYSGTREFSVEVDGVTPEGGEPEKVAVTLLASEANAGEYTYGGGDKTYTARTANTNYTIINGATLTIEKAVPNVTWPTLDRTVYVNDEPLTAAYFTPGSATGVNGADLPGTFTLSGELSWTSSGTKYVSFTFVPDDAVNYVSVTANDVIVTVIKRQVASVEAQTPITDKLYGTDQAQLGLPATVTITTEDGKKFDHVPVTWTGYDSATLTEQNLTGTLDLSNIADEVENLADVKAAIKVTLQPLDPGPFDYRNKTVIYSGQPVPHEIEGDITGVTRVHYMYEGTEDTIYSASADAPTDVGTYTVIATFDMEAGYSAIAPVTVTLIILKAEPKVEAPTPNDRVYDGVSRDLLNAGSAIGGTMVYSMTEDGDYSSTIPARANADTYTVWYRVVGDANYNDAGPWSVTATIRPAALDIPPVDVTYNGDASFQLVLEGVRLGADASESVTATLTAYSKDAAEYAYGADAGSGKYTAALSSSNYVVNHAAALTIHPLAVVLAWSEPLTFTYNGASHTVTATVSNAIRGDALNLSYTDNTGVNEGEYTAAVTDLGNANYTLTDAVNATQTWYITKESEIVTLTADERVIYGGSLTLTATITPAASSIRLMAAAQDEVAFYANGVLLASVPVVYANAGRDSGTATLTIEATSAQHFSAGNSNAVMAVYGGNGNVTGGESASVTVTIDAKPITARLTGDATKTYDGTETATGLSVELEGVEDCDAGKVTAAAASYAFENANAGIGKTIQANGVTLDGEQRGNYVIINDPVTTTGAIERKVVRLVWSGYTDLMYTGSPVNVTATATELVPGDVCEVEVANGDQINAGAYTATAASLSNPNYVLPDTGCVQDYTIAKADPSVTPPVAIDSVYDGTSHALVEPGDADGGAMLYSLTETGEYSAAIPTRTNAGTYTVWYRVAGDENHNDAGPWPVTAIIFPAKINIDPEPVTYNGGTTFPITVDGVNGEIVTVTLTASAKDAGAYDYAAEGGNGKYTASLSSSNYEVGTAKKLTIQPLTAVLAWSEPLTFIYTGETHTVTATVRNAIGDDAFNLSYVGNTGINGGEYTARVISLGNANYTLTDAANVTQTWYIIKESEIVTLTADEQVVYGDQLTLTMTISPAASDIRLMALKPDQAEFYVNGELLEVVDVAYDSAAKDSGTATIIVKATSANRFSAGANAVTAVYSGSDNVNGGGTDAVTVRVDAKPITASISGVADKVYDGSDTAIGLALTLGGVEECDEGSVTASAIAYTFNDSNAGSGKTVTAHNIALDGSQSGNYALDTAPVTTLGTIAPAPLDIPANTYTYNGGRTFTATLDGVNGETVEVTLIAPDKDAGTYAAEQYTVELSSANYAVNTAGPLTIAPKAAVLTWSEPLTFTYDGQQHAVTAAVSNAEQGDTFSLTYVGNTGIHEGGYTAKVVGLGNNNYTLTNAQNVTQAWYITKENEILVLTANDPVTYGDPLTLTATIAGTGASDIRVMALDPDKVEFSINGISLGSVDVTYDSAAKDSGTATLTIDATSANHLSAGANLVTAVYGGNANINGGEAAITVTVNAKPITARLVGDATKTYDGSAVATGLAIELDGVEDCDRGQVTAAADACVYDSANAGDDRTVTARNIALDGAQSGNYILDTEPITTAGVIYPKVVRLEWSGDTDFVYTGEPVNVTAVATDLIPGDVCGVVVINGNEIEPGAYTAMATGLTNPNYALPATGTTQEYTIKKVDAEDPNDPSNTDDPNDPDDPTNTDNPNDPDGPTNTDDPNDPDGPTNTDDPNDPDEPTNTDDPNDPDGPTNTDDPNDPDDPSNTDDPNDPDGPTNTDDPNDPDGPTNTDDPNDPDGPTNTDDPNDPDGPTNTDDPNDPDGPTNTDDPNDPDGPTNTDDPNDPDDPTNTDDPNDPDGPTNTKTPTNTANPSSSDGSDDPTDAPDSTQSPIIPPKTGDTSRLMTWVLLMALSFCGILAILTWGMRSKKKGKR